MSIEWRILSDAEVEDEWGLTPSDVDDILERWLNGEDVSDFEDDGAEALIKEANDG
jgi:hypothetical protein